MDYLSRQAEQTVTVKQLSASFGDIELWLVAEERELLSIILRCHWTTQKILPGDWRAGYNVGPIKSKSVSDRHWVGPDPDVFHTTG